MMADELLNAQDLITAKKHDTFHSEVVTGKAGGVSTGANIDYATNAVTGQVQKTLPKILDDLGWSYVGSFADGETFTSYADYMIYLGVAYKPLTTTTLPYSPTGATPDPAFVGPFNINDHNSLTNRDDVGSHPASAISMGNGNSVENEVKEVEERLLGVGAKIYRGSNGKYLQVGDVIPAPEDTADGLPITHVIVDGNVYAMSPLVYGVVTDITFDGYGFPVSVTFGVSTSSLVLSGALPLFTHVSQFGIKPENNKFWNTQAWVRAKSVTKHLMFDAADYSFSKFEIDDGMSIYMKTGGRILVSDGTAPQVNIGSNVETWNTWFQSLDEDLEWNRVALDNSTDVVMHSPVFKGFKHNAALPNAWGCLIQRCKRIKMNYPRFDDNSQSDIAFTDFNEDIEINYINSVDGVQGARVNFEPNENTPNTRSRFVGGIIKSISLLTNTRLYDVNNFMKFTEVWIKRLNWDGADVIFENCRVDEYVNFRENEVYAGTVSSTNTSGMGLGPNLLPDPYVTSLSSGALTKWVVDFSGLPVNQRYSLNSNPRIVDLNPTSQNGVVYIKNTDIVGTQPDEILLFAITGQLISDERSQIANCAVLRYFNSGTLVKSINVRAFLQLPFQNEAFKTNVAFVKTPAGVDSVQVVIANSFSSSTAKLRLKSVSLHRVEKSSAFDQVLSPIHVNQSELAKIIKPTEIYAYNLPMIDGQDVLIGGFRHTVTDGDLVNPTSNQVVPQISKYDLTVI